MTLPPKIRKLLQKQIDKNLGTLVPANLGPVGSSPSQATIAGVSPIPHITDYRPDPGFRVVIRQEPTVRTNNKPLVVSGMLPENFAIDTTVEWATPFADGVLGQGSKIQTLAQVAGYLPITQSMTAHFWQGASPIDLTLPIILVAHRGPDDILRSLMTLKALTMPTKAAVTGFLKAPGPTLKWNSEAFDTFVSASGKAITTAGQVLADSAAQMVTGNSASASSTDRNKFDQMKSASESAAQSFGSLFTVDGKISLRLGKFLYFNDIVIRSVGEQYDIILGPDDRPLRVTVNVNAITRETPTFESLKDMHQTSLDILDGEQADFQGWE